MYDIHSHIIYGVDDGALSIEESVEMARQAAAEEVDVIIATPHYIEGLYVNEYEDNLERLNKIREQINKAGINISIYLGNELLITPELPKLLKSGSVTTLHNSRYLLLELPFLDIPTYTESVLFHLEIEGYKTILAHPERNEQIIDNPSVLHKLIKQGVCVQMNISSFEGKYGKRVKKTAQYMLRHHMVHFVGTNRHSPRQSRFRMRDIADRMSYYYKDNVLDLLYDNPAKIIKNECLQV